MWWQIGLFILSLGLAYLFRPKTEVAAPPEVKEIDITTAGDGEIIPVLFGTRDTHGNCVWWGDVGSRVFNVSTGDSTWYQDFEDAPGGRFYFVGMHIVLWHGPIDAITAIASDEKICWIGEASDETIWVDTPDLYGGKEQGGGFGGKNLPGTWDIGTSVDGAIDIEMGLPAQTQNAYLQEQINSDISAHRGVVGAVLKQVYIGTSPSLRPLSFRGSRIHLRDNGTAQWYDAKAAIASGQCAYSGGALAIYIALDISLSMDIVVSGTTTRLDNAKTSVNGFLDYIDDHIVGNSTVDIHITAWWNSKTTTTIRDVDSSDISTLKSWVSARTAIFGTDFNQAVADIATFFDGSDTDAMRLFCFISDGDPEITGAETPAERMAIAQSAADTLWATPGLIAHAFNIDLTDIQYSLLLDNTDADSVPVVSDSDPSALQNSLISTLIGRYGYPSGNDLNPAHIIRECLVDPDWGNGHPETYPDSTSFTAAADALYSEGMGISINWEDQSSIEDFIDLIKKHINAETYVSRSTGKYVLKLIRADYDADSLDVLDEDSIVSVKNFKRKGIGELVNSVTVVYWNSCAGKQASVTVQDQALVQMQGNVVNTTVQYPGFTHYDVAYRAAVRDLRALSLPLLSATIYATRDSEDYYPGDVFILSWDDLGIDRVICRVISVDVGDGISNTVRLDVIEDVFALPETQSDFEQPSSEWIDPAQPPQYVINRLATELPYHALVRARGKALVDAILDDDDSAGFVVAAGARPTGAINAVMTTDGGDGYAEKSILEFCPSCLLTAAVNQTDTAWTFDNGTDLDFVIVGQYAQIDDELIIIEAFDADAGTLTAGRGTLDTSPRSHADNARIYFWQHLRGVDPTQYQDADDVDVKLLTVTGRGTLDITQAPEDTVTLDGRADRPYPPGDLQINGTPYPTPAAISAASFNVTWEHRDRLTQTALIDHTDTSISTAEAGTTYTVQVYDDNPTLQIEHTGISGKSQTVTMSGEAEGDYTLQVWAIRDGKDSWQCAEWDFEYILPITGTGTGTLPEITGSASGLFISDTSVSGTGSGTLPKITGDGDDIYFYAATYE